MQPMNESVKRLHLLQSVVLTMGAALFAAGLLKGEIFPISLGAGIAFFAVFANMLVGVLRSAPDHSDKPLSEEERKKKKQKIERQVFIAETISAFVLAAVTLCFSVLVLK